LGLTENAARGFIYLFKLTIMNLATKLGADQDWYEALKNMSSVVFRVLFL